MKITKYILVGIALIVLGYLVSYFGTQFIHNRIYTGEKNIEYVVSTEFIRYNPEFILLEEFDTGEEVRLYEGIFINDEKEEETGYVLVVKDVDRKYRYSFLIRNRGDVYEHNSKYIEGTSYIPLHRQMYRYHTLIILYTYVNDELQYYYGPDYYNDIDTIYANSTTPGNQYSFFDPPQTLLWTYPLSIALIIGVYFGVIEIKKIAYKKRLVKVDYADSN